MGITDRQRERAEKAQWEAAKDGSSQIRLVAGPGTGKSCIFPYRAQRSIARFGEAKKYGWSEEKARHYAMPEREDFGAFVKRRGVARILSVAPNTTSRDQGAAAGAKASAIALPTRSHR